MIPKDANLYSFCLLSVYELIRQIVLYARLSRYRSPDVSGAQ